MRCTTFMLSLIWRRSQNPCRSFSSASSAKRTLTDVNSRPDLDFDYLLDSRNLATIRENIKQRKGIGDIDLVHRLWHEIEQYPTRRERDVDEYQKLWDEVRCV
ncbi:unnamed protein product [Anisakis simplex]|uniref:Uncharacterized protein n=1 Tax=Anisakis simplex TaxID=6269 RepID=A0A0M3JBN1_ANISI|nr:unnamed protein product [Anisakis simplex]